MTATAPEPTNVDCDDVTLTIDGQEVTAKKGELLITAAQRAGIFIPRFCYHDRLKPVGMCRMCLVEIEGVRGLPPACTTPVAEGMNVSFHKDNVEKAQDGVLEFLLINHPLDCPVCDRGGECPLQDQTVSFGPGESRYVEEKRHWEKPIEISDHVLLDRERCIQCSRCTRFADDVAGDPLITFVERGGKTEVNTFPGDDFASYFSGNIVQICPVGALTAKPYRFNSRPWDLTGAETTCQGCSVGCKGEAQTSRNEMVRFLGIDSEPINQGWLCDKGRYGFDFMQSEERIRHPFIKDGENRNPVNYMEAIEAAASVIADAKSKHGPGSIAVIGGARGTNEDAYALSRLAKGIIGTHKVDARVSPTLNPDLILSASRARIADVDHAAAIITVGCDIKESLPLVYLRVRKAVTEKHVPLIDVNPVVTSTAKIAAQTVSLVPGDESSVKSQVVEAIEAVRSANGSSNSKIVLIAGDTNHAQNPGSFEAFISSILDIDGVVLLPAVGPANIMGAYEMGLAPGLLPGRVADISSVAQWPTTPGSGLHEESDTLSILKQAANGEIKVLIVSAANLIDHCIDADLARRALENVETVIAFDCFINETTQYADVFIPTTVANEKIGTVTNIEGRVQRVVQIVAPQGVVMDEWKIATMIAEELGVDDNYQEVGDITNEIARTASSFAHLTTGVLMRARDGAIVPVDDNKDTLIRSLPTLVDTPSWEPIASHAESDDDDPVAELDHEEHHPSANITFAPQIAEPLIRQAHRDHHLDSYGLRLVFVDSFHRNSSMLKNSKTLSYVALTHESHALRVHPKDIESIDVKDSNLVTAKNDAGSVQVRVIPDKNVMRGVAIAQMNADHPLRELVTADKDVVDIRLEAGQ